MRPNPGVIAGVAAIVGLLPTIMPAVGTAQTLASSGAEAPAAAVSNYQLGLKYLYGKEVPADEKKAFELMEQAAASGHAEALGSLGYFYSVGKVVGKDDVKARQYFEQAAEKGSASAQANLARFLVDGRGGAKDANRGVEILQKLVDQGSKAAAAMLGEIYYWGEHADQPDYVKAFAVLIKVAENGNASAQNMVGLMIRDHKVEGYEVEAARAWFLKSAQQGNGKACNNLGQWEFDSPDRAKRIEALRWLLVAKHLEELTATNFLAIMKAQIKDDELNEAQPLADAVIKSLTK